MAEVSFEANEFIDTEILLSQQVEWDEVLERCAKSDPDLAYRALNSLANTYGEDDYFDVRRIDLAKHYQHENDPGKAMLCLHDVVDTDLRFNGYIDIFTLSPGNEESFGKAFEIAESAADEYKLSMLASLAEGCRNKRLAHKSRIALATVQREHLGD